MEPCPKPIDSSLQFHIFRGVSFEIHFNVQLFCVSSVYSEYSVNLILAPKNFDIVIDNS